MTTQATTEGRHNGQSGVMTQVAMTAISLAIVVGVLLWQARPASEPAPSAATTTTAGSTADDVPHGGMAETYQEQVATAATAPTIYLVASQTQADAVRRALDEVDYFRPAPETAPRSAVVVLFPSADADVAFWSTDSSWDLIPITVVDLRGEICAGDRQPAATLVDLCGHASLEGTTTRR